MTPGEREGDGMEQRAKKFLRTPKAIKAMSAEKMAMFAQAEVKRVLEEAAQLVWSESCPECGSLAERIRALAGGDVIKKLDASLAVYGVREYQGNIDGLTCYEVFRCGDGTGVAIVPIFREVAMQIARALAGGE